MTGRLDLGVWADFKTAHRRRGLQQIEPVLVEADRALVHPEPRSHRGSRQAEPCAGLARPIGCILQPCPRAAFYNHREWKLARRQALHDHDWQCTRCGTSLVGQGHGGARSSQKGTEARPMHCGSSRPNLRPLCVGCHNATHAEMKRGAGCDENGMPLDPSRIRGAIKHKQYQ